MSDPQNLEGSFGFIPFRGPPDVLKPACHRITECGERALADIGGGGIHAMAQRSLFVACADLGRYQLSRKQF